MVQADLKKMIIIQGPTAVGKTAVGIELAKKFGGEIVNADSQQIWKGLDIGTAKPDAATRAQVPHYLLDVAEPDEHFDAARFVELADLAIKKIAANGKVPFVVGGTGMYIRMLVHGFCGAPPRNAELRESLSREIEEKGIEALHERLKEVDPVTAGVVHFNDRTRIVRALEIFEATGVAASEFYREHRFEELKYKALKIGLDLPRDELYARINERVDRMMVAGFVDEVRGLLEKYGPDCQAFNAIGYKEVVQFILRASTAGWRDESRNQEVLGLARTIKVSTRRYAKRQLTWFRADQEIKWHTPSQIPAIESEIDTFLRSV